MSGGMGVSPMVQAWHERPSHVLSSLLLTLLFSTSVTRAATLDASATGPSTAAASSAAYTVTIATTGEPFLATPSLSPTPAHVLTPGFVGQIHHPATFVLTSGSGGTSLTLPIGSLGALATASAVVLRLHDTSGELTVQAPAGFEISLSADSGFAASLAFVPVSADLVLHLRVAATTPAGTFVGDLTLALANGPLHGAPLPVSARITSLAAVSDLCLRPPGRPFKISVASLLANDTRSDDGSLALHSFSPTSAEGVSLTRSGAFLLYPAPATLSDDDLFTYTVIDSYGATSTATVVLRVEAPAPAPTATTLSLAPREGGGFVLRLLGIPGRFYTIQVSTDLANWSELATATADAQGLYTIEDPVTPPSGTGRFYRAVYTP